jgi:hypothetical protein
VWLIHDRFNIVCSTTTMSKMKRKWLRVIEYEETGRPLDKTTHQSLLETHPDLDILQEPGAMPVEEERGLDEQRPLPGAQMGMGMSAAPMATMMPAMHPALQVHGRQVELEVPIEPGLDSQLNSQIEAQLQREIAGT